MNKFKQALVLAGAFLAFAGVGYVSSDTTHADKYSLPVLDMYTNSGISAMNETHNQMYLFDGLRPNQEGSFIVASKIIGFINSQI